MLSAGLLWNLRLPGCWGAGKRTWNLVSEAAGSQGSGCCAGGRPGRGPPYGLGPHRPHFFINVLNMRPSSGSNEHCDFEVSMSTRDI